MTEARHAGASAPRRLTFEDLAEGAVFWGEEVVADEAEMVAYAGRYDPWPFHLDAEAGRRTAFGGLVASAGYTFSLWCQSLNGIMRSAGAEWAFLGGYDLHLGLRHPLRPGDRLRLRLEIAGKRPSSRPGRGHVQSRQALLRPDGATVLAVELRFLIATRAGLAPGG
jgi:acyl dehydratase